MAKIERFDGDLKAFASAYQSGEKFVFGSATTNADDLTSQLTPEYLRGYGTVGAADFPPLEWFNAAQYTATQLIAYVHQAGIPEWNALQEYYEDSVVTYDGKIYMSLADGNVGKNPDVEPEWSESGADQVGYAENLLSASQPIVQSATGSTLPSSTPANYTAGDEIAFGYYALTDITNLIVDGFGNLTLSNPLVDTGSVYFESDIPLNISITDLYGYAVEGAATNVTTRFTSAAGATGLTLTEVSGKARGVIDLTQAKAFTFSISEQAGGVNIDTVEKVIRGKPVLLWSGSVTSTGVTIDITDGGKWSRGDFTYLKINVASNASPSTVVGFLYTEDVATTIASITSAGTSSSAARIGVSGATDISVDSYIFTSGYTGEINEIYGVKL